MMAYKIKMLCFFLLIVTISFSQQTLNRIKAISSNNQGSNWYSITNQSLLNEKNINTTEALTLLNVDGNNSFKKVKSVTDNLEIEHTTFQQMLYGYPIAFSTITFHRQPNKLELTGFYVENNGVKPTIKNKPFEAILKNVKEQYLLKGVIIDSNCIKRLLNKNDVALQYVSTTNNLNSTNITDYALCYEMDLIFLNRPSLKLFCDANNAAIIFENDLETNCNSQTFNSQFYGNQTVYSTTKNNNNFLIDDCNYGNKIIVSDNKWDGVNLKISDDSAYNSGVNTSWDTANNNIRSAMNSLYCIRKSLEYYYQIHNKNGGYDGDNSPIYVAQNSPFYTSNGTVYYANASFNHPLHLLRIGNNESKGPNGLNNNINDDVSTLDILGHEITHGVTASTAQLVYAKESGALNESFSDIFGVNIYNYAFNYLLANNTVFNNSWKIGNDRNDIFRNMKNPHITSQPSTYKTDIFWINTATGSDNGGVHTNSQVQNYMYYLLCAGDTGTNANKLHYNIQPIGMLKARSVAYRALTTPGYLTPNATFSEARNAWVHAAVDLYGACSIEAITVGKAWEAVGVNMFGSENICGVHGYNASETITRLDSLVLGGSACATGFTNLSGSVKDVNIYSGMTDIKDGSLIISTPSSLFFIKQDLCMYATY